MAVMKPRTMFWRRLDVAGHDTCLLVEEGGGWKLEGTAVFRSEGAASCLDYELSFDGGWVTKEGVVRGWIGDRRISIKIERKPDGVWLQDGRPVPGLGDCADLDLGFTPATNVSQLRRMDLKIGEAREVTVAWLDASKGTLDTLYQRYERRDAATYWYEAPRFEYAAFLEVDGYGFVEKYPGLWEIET